MRIEEIWDRIRVRSGQFILAKSKLELDVDNFRVLVEDALAEYNRSRPFEKTYSHYIGSPRNVKFVSSAEEKGFYDEEMKQVPEWIAECTPTRVFGSNPLLYGGVLPNPASGGDELIDPLQSPWVYNKPLLSVTLSSQYKIVAVFNHKVIEVVDEISGGKDWIVPTITLEDVWFFKLLQGMFLQGIGRSRRAFTLNDMPILMDADQLYSEGKEMEEKALEDIHANKKIYLTGR